MIEKNLTLSQNHPATDIPSFFIHPCQTASTLAKAAESRQVSIGDYLPLWMGIIGISVGLSVPIPSQQPDEAPSGSIHG
jgi:ubiquitin-like-conjugating enzyme ATG10